MQSDQPEIRSTSCSLKIIPKEILCALEKSDNPSSVLNKREKFLPHCQARKTHHLHLVFEVFLFSNSDRDKLELIVIIH